MPGVERRLNRGFRRQGLSQKLCERPYFSLMGEGTFEIASAMNEHRIVVVGVTGSGKTTLARNLSKLFGVRYVELDSLFWEPNWIQAPLDRFRRRISEATACESWVVDGNYSRTQDITWTRATTLVWLDYSLPPILWRLWWRVLRRGVTRQALWNGNRERLWEHFLSRKSLFLWALKSHRRLKADYPVKLRRAEYAHLEVVRLRSPAETRSWLGGLASIKH